MNQSDLRHETPPFITSWHQRDAKYIFCIDESGNHDMGTIDLMWPILSLFGARFDLDSFIDLGKSMLNLKQRLWPPDGTFEYEHAGELIKREVCFHSRDMRRMTGPFSKSVLSDSDRELMDKTLWCNIIGDLRWSGISSIIDKQRLCHQYRDPFHSYVLAVTFMLERLVMSVRKPAIVLLESRGKREDAILWGAVKYLFANGTNYIEGHEFMERIFKIGWRPKFDANGRTNAGLEIADLCAFAMGAKYFRTRNRFADMVVPKLLGHPNSVLGRGQKIFP